MDEFYDLPLPARVPSGCSVFGIRPDGERVLLHENLPLRDAIRFREQMRGEFSRLVLEFPPASIGG